MTRRGRAELGVHGDAAGTSAPRHPHHFWWVLWAGIVLSGCLYVGQRWSPSSYAVVLNALGVADTGVVAGVPRVERGDEFAWQTPLLQMTIRSGFQRFDRTPPYFEDLRSLYGMPIRDWAIVFKAQFWFFFVASPSFAFSFYHYFLIALFVVGFTLILIRLGGGEWPALFMAIALFFSGFVQYWWDGSSNFFLPFFPWIVLALLWHLPFVLRLALLYWWLVAGLLTYFYPPNAIALGFVALILWVTIRPELLRWRSLLAIGSTTALAGATAVFYLRDAITILAGTVYPGQRVSGGGGLPDRMLLAQLLPTSVMNHHVPLVAGPNICELSTIGSIYALAVIIFLDWRAIVFASTHEERRRWVWLGAGLLATQAWMGLPLPAWAGYPLLWHLVPPGRMVMAGGLMLMVMVFVLGQARPLVFSAARCILLAAILVSAWSLFKRPLGIGFGEAYQDWVFIVPVVAAMAALKLNVLTPARANATLLASAALLGVVSFGTFNPIQSTVPIFEKHDTSVTAQFDRQLRDEGRGYLLLPWGSSFFSHSGLPLIAMGYPSLSYSTFDPAMDLWAKIYPDTPAEQLRRTFRNVGSIGFGDVPDAKWMPIYTLAPMTPFTRPGVTVCDVIRPSRTAFAGSAGCPTIVPQGTGGDRP
ncbi:MAG: hypothetical protein GEU82_12490 [Luteitalea sp.]|nr:hypothetical protein [Luteitalea sp.]